MYQGFLATPATHLQPCLLGADPDNKHQRKAIDFTIAMSEFCEGPRSYSPNQWQYLPKGWTILLVFRAKKPVEYIWDVPPSDMQRDAVLCPAHTAALERQLKQLSSNDLDRPQGSA
jgi:hypothetical protein